MKATVFLGAMLCHVLWGPVIPVLSPAGITPFVTHQSGTIHCPKKPLRGAHAIEVDTRMDSASGGFLGVVSLDGIVAGAVIAAPIGRAGIVAGTTYVERHKPTTGLF